jgi:putative ABC transport system permease protein
MRAILRKAFVDLRSRKLQTALILVILTAATATLSLAVMIQRSSSNSWDRVFAEANGAHIWFSADSTTDLTPIAKLDGVTGTVGPLSSVEGQSVVVDHEKYSVHIYGMSTELPKVGHPLVTDGRWLAAGGADEIVLERTFATELGLKVGDTAEVLTAGGMVPLKVVGLAINTEYGLYPNWTPGRAFVLESTLPRFTSDEKHFLKTLGVQLADPQALAPFVAQAMKLYPDGKLTYENWLDIRKWVNFNNKIIITFMGVFSLFALIAVGFIIVNAIGGVVLSQFREIGLLKATGFTPGQVTLLFELEYLGLGLVAGVIGLGLGMLLAPLFLKQTAALLNTTPTPIYDPLYFLAILAGIELAVGLSTLVPAWQGGRVKTVQAITTGFAQVQAKPSLPARLAIRLRLSPVIVLGVKDAFARPLRAILTTFGLSLTVLMVVFTLCVKNTAQSFLTDPAMRGMTWDVYVVRGNLSDAETQKILELPEIQPYLSAYYMEFWTEAKIVGSSDSIGTRALSGAYDQFDIVTPQGRMFSAPNEAVVGIGLLNKLNLKVGDELHFLVDGKPLDLHIVGQYVEMSNSGEMAMYSLDTLHQQTGSDAEPGEYLLKLAPGADGAALKAALLRLSNEQFQVDVNTNTPPALLDQLNFVLLGLNIVLVAIGLVNLLNTTLLGVRERMRDLGLLKTIGLSPRQMVVSVSVGVGILALLAAAVGIPLGLFISKTLFAYISNSMMGLGIELNVSLAWWQIALLVPGAVILALLGGLIPARWAAAVKVVDALRYE